MRKRLHKKVWLAWGKYWAVQVYRGPYFSLGLHIDFRKPYMDVHFWWVIASVGREPVMTAERDRHRTSCRGFLFKDDPVL